MGRALSRYALLLGTFWRHLKTEATTNRAIGVYAQCLAYCTDNQTDGHLPASIVEGFCKRDGRAWKATLDDLTTPKKTVADEDATPWLHVSEHGYSIHDYTDVNITRAASEQLRGKDAARQATRRAEGNQTLSPDVTPDKAPLSSVTLDTRHKTQDTGQEPQPLCAADLAAEVYPAVTGSTELGLPGSRTHKQDRALVTMGRWAGGDRAKLTAELKRLAADDWLASQPIHIWADRIGTGGAATPHGGKSFAERQAAEVPREY